MSRSEIQHRRPERSSDCTVRCASSTSPEAKLIKMCGARATVSGAVLDSVADMISQTKCRGVYRVWRGPRAASAVPPGRCLVLLSWLRDLTSQEAPFADPASVDARFVRAYACARDSDAERRAVIARREHRPA